MFVLVCVLACVLVGVFMMGELACVFDLWCPCGWGVEMCCVGWVGETVVGTVRVRVAVGVGVVRVREEVVEV